MTTGTFHLTVSSRSSSSRLFDLWTIWLTANGAAGASGMGAVMRGERLGDLVQPFVELARRAAR